MQTIRQLLDVDPNPTEAELAARRAYWRSIAPAIGAKWESEPVTPDCSTCGGLGWVVYRKLDNGVYIGTEAGPCNNPTCPVMTAQRDQRFAHLLTSAQIPPEYEALSFAAWGSLDDGVMDGKRAGLEAAVAFVHAREHGFRFAIPESQSAAKNSLVFAGANGVGKTSLAVSIAAELLSAGVAVKYALAGDLFNAMRERIERKREYEYESDSGDQASVMRAYQDAPVLVLDELPRPPGRSDWWKDLLYQLVNHRYTRQLPTVMTTNLTPRDLETLWGMTISTRVLAMAHWVEVTGMDMRAALAGQVVESR